MVDFNMSAKARELLLRFELTVTTTNPAQTCELGATMEKTPVVEDYNTSAEISGVTWISGCLRIGVPGFNWNQY